MTWTRLNLPADINERLDRIWNQRKLLGIKPKKEEVVMECFLKGLDEIEQNFIYEKPGKSNR